MNFIIEIVITFTFRMQPKGKQKNITCRGNLKSMKNTINNKQTSRQSVAHVLH